MSRIKVVMCEPDKMAYVTEIEDGLKSMQEAVDGLIELYYPFESNEAIVCNEEGKINGSHPCRAIFDESGNVIDIVFGKFFICDCSGENLASLSEEKQKQYLKQFGLPELFFKIDENIKALKYKPEEA